MELLSGRSIKIKANAILRHATYSQSKHLKLSVIYILQEHQIHCLSIIIGYLSENKDAIILQGSIIKNQH